MSDSHQGSKRAIGRRASAEPDLGSAGFIPFPPFHRLPSLDADAPVMELLARRFMLVAPSMKYSLVCHATRTRVVVGGDGRVPGQMLLALDSYGARSALGAFLLHNRSHALFLVADAGYGPIDLLDYYDFGTNIGEEADTL